MQFTQFIQVLLYIWDQLYMKFLAFSLFVATIHNILLSNENKA